MDLRRFIEEKWARNGKICYFWVEPAHWYLYQKWVPIVHRGIGTGTKCWRTGTHSPGSIGTGASSNPIFVPLALLSLVFVHRLFRDPNKGLMGVHIRVYERENVPYLATSTKRYSFSMIIRLTTKSGEFVFD